jgi:hypothetical protein
MNHDRVEACIEACIRCATECEACVSSSQAEGGTSVAERRARLSLDCASACRMAAVLLGERRFAFEGCRLCATVCDACAAECERQSRDDLRQCAVACRACADACRRIAGSGPVSVAAPARRAG